MAALQKSEWVISVGFLCILAALLAISRLQNHRQKAVIQQFSEQKKEIVSLAITGEVMRPGVFSAVVGERLGDVIKKSRPKKFADLRSIHLDSPITQSMGIAIAPLSVISVRIVGAVVEEVAIQVPPGARICDLKQKIQLSSNGDPRFFKRRKQLSDGEVLVVPERALD